MLELVSSNEDNVESLDDHKKENDAILYRMRQRAIHQLLLLGLTKLEAGLKMAIKHKIKDSRIDRITDFILKEPK